METSDSLNFAVESVLIRGTPLFPNNDRLPLLVYRPAGASRDRPPPAGEDLARFFERLFTRGLWPAAWRNGVYGFHHYHSTAHEALGVYGGRARVQFGGEGGPAAEIGSGDAVVIPAGVSHKLIDSSGDFRVVGAYPAGQEPDLRRGGPEDAAAGVLKVRNVPLPAGDPLLGPSGPLLSYWRPAE